MKRVAIRVDASAKIGTGHLTRCLSLVAALLEKGAQVSIVTRALDGVAVHVLRDMPCHVHWLPAPLGDVEVEHISTPHAAWAGVTWAQDATETANALCSACPDWLVVDHYAFDARWHGAMREALGCRLLVIDDTADRSLAPDALLDHNWEPDHRGKYVDRLTMEPHWFAGPRYALLSPAYRSATRYLFQSEVRSIGIFMGGTDPDGISARVLAACRTAGFVGSIEVVSTSVNPSLIGLRQACSIDPDATLTLDEPDLSAFFARHDLQVGAGGGATWERCCIGAPSILVALAPNQLPVLRAVDALGLAIQSGTSCLELADSVREAIDKPALRLHMSQSAFQLVDGRGAERVAFHLISTEPCHGQCQPASE